ncbi:MAG: hypothetical protein K0S32_1265 [Bacteroidetes bacterium]|jgi:hypothetical protein|nr:hypothetical protein [Bacteroidota bacterium]
MKSTNLKHAFYLLIVGLCFSCSSHKPEDEITDAIQSEKSQEIKSDNNLKGMTVDEFFEYTKNPVFQKSEMVGTIIPYYSRRMMEVKISGSPGDIQEAKEKFIKMQHDLIDEVHLGPSLSASKKQSLKTLATEVENVFMGKIKISFPKVEDYIVTHPYADISDKNNMTLTILKSHQLAFELSIEGGVPLDYTSEIAGLRNDSLFTPEYISQSVDEQSNVVNHAQFIFNDAVFRIYPMEQDDYYDSQIITAAANMALSYIRSDKRYYQLDDDRNVVLATKKEIDMLCRKFGWKIK